MSDNSSRNSRSLLKVIPFALLILSLACSLPGVTLKNPATATPAGLMPTLPPPTATPEPLPPALVESDPPPGSVIPLAKPITFYFNQDMDRPTVEGALSGQPRLSGKFSWKNDSTMTFEPDAPLLPDTDLSVSIGTTARSKKGLALLNPLTLKYHTTGYLRLTQILPVQDANDVDPTSAIVAAFNRPVIPLGADPSSLRAAFTVISSTGSPPEGKGQWVNTSMYIFYPQPALAGGQVYTVQIDNSLLGADGAPLEKEGDPQSFPYVWTFTTAFPRLVSVSPEADSTDIRLDSKVVLTFNQKMDNQDVQANFSLLDSAGNPVAGDFIWDAAGKVMTYTVSTLLKRNSQYHVELNQTAKAAGGTSLDQGLNTTFNTVPDLAITGTNPPHGGTTRPGAPVDITFSSYLPDDADRYVVITPAVPNLFISLDYDRQTLHLYGDLSPATDYTVTVAAELKDEWGQALGQSYQLNFRSGPLDPTLFFNLGLDVLFLSPQEKGLAAQAANISRVPLSLGKVLLDDFIVMLSPDGYNIRQTFQPAGMQSWEDTLDLPPNRVQPVVLALSQDKSSLTPGLYYLRVNSVAPGFNSSNYLLVVSNIQLTFKLGVSDILVWAIDMRNGKPLPDAPIVIYDENGVVLAKGQTDPDGVYAAPIPPRKDPFSVSYAVVGNPGEDTFGMALSNWNQGIDSSVFGLPTAYAQSDEKDYIYTDRPIYRPGQVVYFKAVSRKVNNGRYTISDSSTISLTLYNDTGEPVTTFNLPLSAFGTAHGQVELSIDARPGYYRLGNENASVYFQVADYRKPEINLQVSFRDKETTFGQALLASVNARYFFDAPVSNIAVQWTLYSKPAAFDLAGYRVGKEDTGWLSIYPTFGFNSLGEPVGSGEAQTGPDGLLSLTLPTNNAKVKDERRTYTLEVTVVDESGLPVSARASLEVNPASFYIGVKPDIWVGQAGSAIAFEILTVDWNKNPDKNRALHADFQKVTWIRQDPAPGKGGLGPTYVHQYSLIASTDFATGSDGLARVQFVPTEPGTYQLSVSSENAHTDVLLWVSGPGQAVWPDLPNQRMRLTTDRQTYNPGDTAKVFIPNPFPEGGLALVTVERAIVMSHQMINLQGAGVELPFPLTDEDAPNVYISVTLLGKDGQGQPDFRQGYAELSVAPVQETLNVTLTSQPERTGPGDTVTFSIHIADAGGKPVQGEFSLSVVDLAIFALADANSPDILSAFYGEQPLGVRTALDLAASASRYAFMPGGMGGGGGAAPQVVRENFPDTAYWNAEILTDASGNAQVTMTLPDNLTTWQVDLRGVTQNTLVGQAQAQIVTTKELLIRPVTPRFLVVDDHAMLAAVVQNNTTADLDADVSLQAAGFRLDDSTASAQKVHVPAGGRVRLEWWGTAGDVDKVDAVFSVSAGNLSDASRPTGGALPVLYYTAPQTFATSGVLDAAGERLELVSLPRSFDAHTGSLRLELSPSLAAGMLDSLNLLEQYPYNCTEQTLSRFLPNLEVYRAVQTFGIDAPDLKARMDRTLSQNLTRLMLRQNSDGGWGWWSDEQSNPYITAYILFGLGRIIQAGIQVDNQVVQRAVDYLNATMPNTQNSPNAWEIDRLAFINFALSEVGAASSSGPDALYTLRDQMDPWAQALLALTLQKLDPAGERVNTLLSDLQSTASLTATGAHWQDRQEAWQNLVSPETATAMVVYALARREPASTLIPEAVRYMMSNRKTDGAWGSTYETAWSLMALTEVMKGTGELAGSYSFTASLNGTPLAAGQAGGSPTDISPVVSTLPLDSLYSSDPNALLIQRQAGSGRLYYSAYLNVNLPVEMVASLDQGIHLTRGVYPSSSACPQTNCAALQSASVGETVSVRLSLALPQDVYNLVVEDYIPAGAEILNTSLKTSQQGTTQPEYDPAQPFSAGWGWWLFQSPQIYDDHITWSANYLPAGTYTLTYNLVLLQAGEYRILPAHAWLFYFPEVQGISAGAVFDIKQASTQ
jgi:uncharacterized protein YfaS (alpha-2-macroglobulin family)